VVKRGGRATVRPAADSPAGLPVPAIVYLSGSLRGRTFRLSGDALRIGTAPDAEITIPADTQSAPSAHHATLRRRGRAFELIAEPGREVWVNGEPAVSIALASGDLLEIGRDGALMRFRLYPADSPAWKSLPEVFSDCLDCARYAKGGPLARAGLFLATVPVSLATQTSLVFRAVLWPRSSFSP
jgi:hypothetical protein